MNEFDRNATLSHQNTESQQRSQKPTNSSLHYSVLILYIIYITCVYHTHAAAAAKSFQSCPTLCNPIDSSPTGSPVPGILQARTLEWVAISFSNAWKWKVQVKLLSRVQLLATPCTAAYQAPLPVGFSRQEYWRGVPLPSPIIHTHIYITQHKMSMTSCSLCSWLSGTISPVTWMQTDTTVWVLEPGLLGENAAPPIPRHVPSSQFLTWVSVFSAMKWG